MQLQVLKLLVSLQQKYGLSYLLITHDMGVIRALAHRLGVKDIYFVVGEQSTQVQSYYRSNIQLNDYLRRAGKEDKLPLVAPLRDVRIHFLTQPGTGGYGTSIPVGLASEFIEPGESAFVVMGDQFFWCSDGGSNAADLAELVEARGLSAGLLGNPVEESLIPQTAPSTLSGPGGQRTA